MAILSVLKRQSKALLAAIAALFILVPAAYAMRVSPMVVEMGSNGPRYSVGASGFKS